MLQIRQINEVIRLGILDLYEFANHIQANLSRRELEKSGANYLITQLMQGQAFELSYTEHNKPYFKSRSEHLSISHSHDKLAVIINTVEKTGIDIELVRDKVKQIQHKFLSDPEQKIAANDTSTLITFWAVKEALYKLYGLKELDFKQHLFIERCENKSIRARIQKDTFDKCYELACEDVEEYKLVYVINEI